MKTTATALDFEAAGHTYDATLYTAGDQHQLVLLPDWEGSLTDYAHRKARWLAERLQGRVLLTDLYGKDRKPTDYMGDAEVFIERSLGDPLALRDRLAAFAQAACAAMQITPQALSVAGFCFGGSLAFELGRAGIGIRAAVSIHGTPSTTRPIDRRQHATRYLMIHGGSDPLITGNSINRFIDEMTRAQADWQLLVLGHARHSFTKEELGRGGHASAYDSRANQRALEQAAAFVEERLDD